MLLQGYEDAKQSPDDPSLPPSIDMAEWVCLNRTIGASIPLVGPGPKLTEFDLDLILGPGLIVFGFAAVIIFLHVSGVYKKCLKGGDESTSYIPLPKRGFRKLRNLMNRKPDPDPWVPPS